MQNIRGVKDKYFLEANCFRSTVETAYNFATEYAFEELIVPIIEFAELFERNLGADTDVISKEIYRFLDRSNEAIALRPEFTAGVVRAYIQDCCKNFTPVATSSTRRTKLFSHGSVFRYDRPQKGRYRQFNQLNFEIFKQKHPEQESDKQNDLAGNLIDDAEIITLGYRLLKTLNLKGNIKLEINTLGSSDTIKKYSILLKEYFLKHIDSLSELDQKRAHTNPLRVLDSKDSGSIQALKEAPKLKDSLSPEEVESFNNLLSLLKEISIPFEINDTLVRGLDYYTGVVFEFVTDGLGTQSTLLAGGRYDNLVKHFSKGKINALAVGFAAGIERLMLLQEENDISATKYANIFIVPVSQNELFYTFKLADLLRGKISNKNQDNSTVNANDISVILSGDIEQSLSKRMKRIGATATDSHHNKSLNLAIIIGEEEQSSKNFKVKNLTTFEEYDSNIDDLLSSLCS